MDKESFLIAFTITFILQCGFSQNPDLDKRIKEEVSINGVFPNLTALGTSDKGRSESGIGALIPWADKLWMIRYVAHIEGSTAVYEEF